MDNIRVKLPIRKMYVNTESKSGKKFDTPRITVYTDEDLVDDADFKGIVSIFDNGEVTSDWKEGMELDVELQRVVTPKGTFWNIVPPKNPSKFEQIEERIAALEKAVFKKRESIVEESKDDLPF